jgi:hypothetical protein
MYSCLGSLKFRDEFKLARANSVCFFLNCAFFAPEVFVQRDSISGGSIVKQEVPSHKTTCKRFQDQTIATERR